MLQERQQQQLLPFLPTLAMLAAAIPSAPSPRADILSLQSLRRGPAPPPIETRANFPIDFLGRWSRLQTGAKCSCRCLASPGSWSGAGLGQFY